MSSPSADLLDTGDQSLYDFTTTTDGPGGRLPLESKRLAGMSSGELFGWTQNVGMGLDPVRLVDKEFLILSTLGGRRGADGEAIALGLHTGHWELGMLVDAAAATFTGLGTTPYAVFVSDPCDGRTNGTLGMLDSLPYRNDAAIVLRRLVRSLPSRSGALGVASCDKGLPAMMMALAGTPEVASVLVPGGVMLLTRGAEDTAAIQSLSARFARGEISLDYASVMGCVACGSAGGGCQFMGTAATSQVVAEAMGWSLPHSALHPSGTRLWTDLAERSARALVRLAATPTSTGDLLSDQAIRNAMVLHAAVGGSTNLYLHLPAIAHAAGLQRPTAEDWVAVTHTVPRLVDALPNGPKNYATVQVFLAGGVPEVMLRLAGLDLLSLDVPTVAGISLANVLEWWEKSDRRRAVRQMLESEGIDPNDVIRTPDRALPGTVTIMHGNLAPGGAIVKSTAIQPDLIDDSGIYETTGSARVFTSEDEAITALKERSVRPGEVIVLIGVGPSFGMPETYQITSALKSTDNSGQIPLITDGRFSGVSSGPCIGHVTPEAAAGGPLGRVRDGDQIRIVINTREQTGSVEAMVEPATLASRRPHIGLEDRFSLLPDDTRLWAALHTLSGGSWGGCVYDTDSIIARLSGAPDP